MTDPMPVFVLKAKDRLALDAVNHYYWLCEKAGLTEQATEVRKAIDEMVGWRIRNHETVQMPDHKHVPATADLDTAYVDGRTRGTTDVEPIWGAC